MARYTVLKEENELEITLMNQNQTPRQLKRNNRNNDKDCKGLDPIKRWEEITGIVVASRGRIVPLGGSRRRAASKSCSKTRSHHRHRHFQFCLNRGGHAWLQTLLLLLGGDRSGSHSTVRQVSYKIMPYQLNWCGRWMRAN